MSGEGGFEDWDEDFLDQLVQAEELALSSANPTQQQQQQQQQQPPPRLAVPYSDISYSPPRELSQRVVSENPSSRVFSKSKSSNGTAHTHATVARVHYVSGAENANKEQEETDKLKKELGRVSKQLTLLEQECLELRKERDKKEEQLRSVFSGFEEKHNEAPSTKSGNLAKESEHIQDHPRVSNRSSSKDQVGAQINVGTTVSKAIGVQTDNAGESINLNIKDESYTPLQRSEKLPSVWDPPSGSQSGRNLVSKLFVACETDLLDLFGCLSSSLSSKTTVDSPVDKSSSDVAFQRHKHPVHSAEAAKVSHLYSMLTKINNDMVTLEALLEALVDLCRLESVAIVYRSLRVLGMVLNHCFSIEKKSDRWDNVMVEQPPSGNDTADIYGPKCSEIQSLFLANTNKTSEQGNMSFQMRLFNAEIVCKNNVWNHGSVMSMSSVDWVSLFELVHQIAMTNKEEHVRLEAVFIMNMILMRTNAYSGREKFGQVVVFRSVSQLLRKEAGLGVQKQAVHLLYLLLNCPKLLAIFCSSGKEEGENAGATNSDAKNASVFEGFSAILEGLADCVACNGNGKQGLKLRRNAINLLAFVASSGKCGFEILLGHNRLSKRTSFLALILQVLISETDSEASDPVQPSEIFKERTLLIREALILLNRLVSNPQYSTPVLRVLTNSRDVASLTIDIASRLSRKGKWLWQSDTMTRQMRETEVVDLAHVFRKRVFSFLGDNIS